jgi:hypothetical protein
MNERINSKVRYMAGCEEKRTDSNVGPTHNFGARNC